MSIRRKVPGEGKRLKKLLEPVNNRSPKNWDKGYELVVSFQYGLDERAIANIAGLRNYDTGVTLKTMVRDLQFPCGTDRLLAHNSANRLLAADHFHALRIRISYPVEHVGADTFTPWHASDGKLIERIKHRKHTVIVFRKGKKRRRVAAA